MTKRAVEFRDSRCCVDKCSDEAFLQIDHINPWANSGETTLANARRLCVFHHRLITNKNFRLVYKANNTWRLIAPGQFDVDIEEGARAGPIWVS